MNPKILVVDDEELIRNRLRDLLELDDYEVYLAENGIKGLEVFDPKNPDAVLLDLKMPGMDGLEVLEKIKESETNAEVIIITGHGGVSIAVEAMRKGAFSYVQKPVEYDELEIDIKRVLEKQNLEKRLDDHVSNLKESEERFRAVAQTAGDAIITIDHNGDIAFWNKAAESMFGYNQDEISGKQSTYIMAEQYRELHTNGVRRAISMGKSKLTGKTVELEGLKKSGECFPIELSVAMFWTGDDVLFTGIIRDITSRKKNEKKLKEYGLKLEEMVADRTKELENALENLKKTQDQFLHVEKMASIGQLAAGVAHEINNPTTFVNVNAHTMEKWWKLMAPLFEKAIVNGWDKELGINKLDSMKETFPEMIQAIKNGASRISSITGALRSFARADHTSKEMFNIYESLESAVMITKNQYKYHADLTIKKEDEMLEIYGNSQQMEQVFINMIVNASHTIEDKVELMLSRNKDFKGLIKITLQILEYQNSIVEVLIQDNGMGMNSETKKKLFDPFFTTKVQDKGTGLGMSIVYGIISEHDGSISVDSQKGEGTTFIIHLPVVKKKWKNDIC